MHSVRLLAVAMAALVIAGCGSGDATQPGETGANAGSQTGAATRPVSTTAESGVPERTPEASQRKARNDDARKLQQIVDQYFTQYLALNPLRATEIGDHRFDDRFGDYASPSWMADSLGIEQESLERLAQVDPRRLRGDELVTYDTFKRQRELNIGGFRYPSELLPIDPYKSLAEEFVLLGSGKGAHPFRTTRDYDAFLGRMDGFVAWVDQAINNLRAGVSKELVLPKDVVVRVLPQLEAVGRIENPRDTPFWRPLLSFPAGPTVADRRRLLEAYDEKLRNQVLPAYRRLHDYLANEYLPVARSTAGWSELPGGDFWYAYLVRFHSSSDMTPADAHSLGVKEVARLQVEAERLKNSLGLAGTLREAAAAMRLDPERRLDRTPQVTGAYAAVHARVAQRLPALFARLPTTALELRTVEPYRSVTAPAVAYRQPGGLGARPGVLYLNTHEPASRAIYLVAAQYLREAVPGRHYQAALMQQSETLPAVRRFGQIASYQDGWAAYAATLGRDLGLYENDAFSEFGALTLELDRAALLVVDTGLHAQGWTRERAMLYLREQTAMTDAETTDAVDRCIAQPAAALAGPVGRIKIAELRDRAERQLGPRFDVRQFHDQVAGSGAMPWATLELRVDRWIASQT
jgi:uncharacterized protein (DUF885 family)